MRLARLRKEAAALRLACDGARRCKAEQLLQILANRHCAQNVEEDEAAIGVIVANEISMAEALNQRDRLKWQFCDDATLENRAKRREKRRKNEADRKHRFPANARATLRRILRCRLHAKHRQIAIRRF